MEVVVKIKQAHCNLVRCRSCLACNKEDKKRITFPVIFYRETYNDRLSSISLKTDITAPCSWLLVREIYKKIKISYVFAHTWKSSGRNLFFIADSQDILRIKLIYAMIKLAHPEISEMIPIIRIVKTDKMTNEMKDAYKRIKGAK